MNKKIHRGNVCLFCEWFTVHIEVHKKVSLKYFIYFCRYCAILFWMYHCNASCCVLTSAEYLTKLVQTALLRIWGLSSFMLLHQCYLKFCALVPKTAVNKQETKVTLLLEYRAKILAKTDEGKSDEITNCWRIKPQTRNKSFLTCVSFTEQSRDPYAVA